MKEVFACEAERCYDGGVPPKNPTPDTPALPLPTSFQVGEHVVRVSKVMEGRWTVEVDGSAVAGSFATQAEAWEAGVREVDRRRQPSH